MDLRQIKQRFGIIGDDPELNKALEIARQVAGTDLSVLVTGESGVGKDIIPQIIHQNSPRKHGVYIAVNCGAIPEGTKDSELFGHEKGSFTGATETRKGYFEEADGGTLFLDEVAELPLSTQVRLLRVLQSGEFMKVGSSKVQKTNVRVIAATNINLIHAIEAGRFREDLYYRLNIVPIHVPALRERKQDIYQLFKKFALDFADRYMMPPVRLDAEAQIMLESYRWPGNVRQLKSVAEQISILETNRTITPEVLQKYLPASGASTLVRASDATSNVDYAADRDIIFKILLQLRQDVDALKEQLERSQMPVDGRHLLINPEDVRSFGQHEEASDFDDQEMVLPKVTAEPQPQTFSIQDASSDLIKKALEKHGGNRKAAAEELGISERTLYRKIKQMEKK
jgi:Response regulator containing CheY-like receiver, AAA-type ATPase, and DNA-binding domains